MSKSRIEWTERTWNPTTGCTKYSDGCMNCYAEIWSHRLKNMGVKKYENGFRLTLHPDTLQQPLKWKPSIVFVNSMSDLFHEDVPSVFIHEVFGIMNSCPKHFFQILTKRSERLAELSSELNWTPNICMGVTVEESKYKFRIDILRRTGARIKFLSFEPLLGPLAILNLEGINWVIVGGESGVKSRSVKKEWIIDIRDQCEKVLLPFFFKQWGGFRKKANGRNLDGIIYDEVPEAIQTHFRKMHCLHQTVALTN